jgi:hypothetical protein
LKRKRHSKALRRSEKMHPARFSLFLIVYLHLQWNAVLTQIMLCLAEAVLRNSRLFCVNPYWISTRKVKSNIVEESFFDKNFPDKLKVPTII